MITVDLNRLNLRCNMNILDVGCGTGRHTCALTRLTNNMVVGADLDVEAAREAKRRLQWERGLGVQQGRWGVIVSDVRSMPFRDEFFDLIVCSELMEHVVEQDRAVKELVRVLKTGCDMVISVPRYVPEKICWAISSEYGLQSGGHVRIYKKRELIRIFELEGMKKWSFHFAHALHSPYWWLKCLVGVDKGESKVVNHYHKFLLWDMFKAPLLTRVLEKVLNPVMGKSLVLYFRKLGHA